MLRCVFVLRVVHCVVCSGVLCPLGVMYVLFVGFRLCALCSTCCDMCQCCRLLVFGFVCCCTLLLVVACCFVVGVCRCMLWLVVVGHG